MNNLSTSFTSSLKYSCALLLAWTAVTPLRAESVFQLSQLDISQMEQGWGEPRANRSVADHALSVGGRSYTNGIGTCAPSEFIIDFSNHGGSALRFSALVGVDDEVGPANGDLIFRLVGDGLTLWQSPRLHAGDPAQSVDISLAGIKELQLLVEGSQADRHNHADWLNGQIVMAKGKPAVVSAIKEPAVILTPKPSPRPRINSAQVFGVRPGSPFLYTIAATGDRPMTFAVDGLPKGLKLDSQTGIITGRLEARGEHALTLRAKNNLGEAMRSLRLVCGDAIGLTPAMGWNSWNCFASTVTAEKIKSAADAMVRSGLINHGWTYVNIDDYWQVHRNSTDPTLQGPQRDAQGKILPNPRFPDMKALTDYVHALGLKAGIYSSPGPWTCGGCVASFDHEQLDAQSYGDWGFDYLKYDWCSYGPGLEKQRTRPADFSLLQRFPTNGSPAATINYMRPYAVMRSALNQVHRDILYSFCQYGLGDVWQWGTALGGNSWRTTYDIIDKWKSPDGLSVSDIGFNQNGLEQYAGPGHFNDPDMLVIGKVGWGPDLHPTRLTPNEQYTHISLWCLLSAPLLIGCDMTQLDDFTLSLLTNDEVLAVDQDPLGRQAARVAQAGATEVWAKDMADGSKAVGLFNRGYTAAPVTVRWSDLGWRGGHAVRDLWPQKDLGTFTNEFQATIPRHGVVLVKVNP